MTGSTQRWSHDDYARNAHFVPALGEPLIDMLRARPGEAILDLGCGDGTLTACIAETGADVIGVDASADMLAAAQSKGLQTRRLDGQRLDYDARFDAVFTNAALHWMPDHDAVLAGVRGALKPGGRFVGEFGGHGNVAAIVTALIAAFDRMGIDGTARMPWRFPTPQEWRDRLERHGFDVRSCDLIPRPTPLPTGMTGWLRTLASPCLSDLTDAQRDELLSRTEDLLAHALRDAKGNWTADYVRLRFCAVLP
ncbi:MULTISPECIES: class I SAM-dependent methyltransferase [unclassified Roseitalea]|uniref:class I SAM-dependent methyltransferase n=1 Tax=unclassified Roseitalea TaxID=2639107 RepID=UPI00273F0C50|nr:MULTISPECIES: class I SAM-dependent methyltransferase [unclassified Roseitalea]